LARTRRKKKLPARGSLRTCVRKKGEQEEKPPITRGPFYLPPPWKAWGGSQPVCELPPLRLSRNCPLRPKLVFRSWRKKKGRKRIPVYLPAAHSRALSLKMTRVAQEDTEERTLLLPALITSKKEKKKPNPSEESLVDTPSVNETTRFFVAARNRVKNGGAFLKGNRSGTNHAVLLSSSSRSQRGAGIGKAEKPSRGTENTRASRVGRRRQKRKQVKGTDTKTEGWIRVQSLLEETSRWGRRSARLESPYVLSQDNGVLREGRNKLGIWRS